MLRGRRVPAPAHLRVHKLWRVYLVLAVLLALGALQILLSHVSHRSTEHGKPSRRELSRLAKVFPRRVAYRSAVFADARSGSCASHAAWGDSYVQEALALARRSGFVVPCRELPRALNLTVCVGKCIIAANLHNSEHVLPNLLVQLVRAAQLLGPANLLVSIYAGGSTDATAEWLELLESVLRSLGVATSISPRGKLRRARGQDRIAFLASVRQAAVDQAAVACAHLGPDWILPGAPSSASTASSTVRGVGRDHNSEGSAQGSAGQAAARSAAACAAAHLVFLNDVFFDAADLIRLLQYRSGSSGSASSQTTDPAGSAAGSRGPGASPHADLVCGVDVEPILADLPEAQQRAAMAAHLTSVLGVPAALARRLSGLSLPFRYWKKAYRRSDSLLRALPLLLYDVWVARDVGGGRLYRPWPFSRHEASARRLAAGLPVAAHCCWNGLAALPAAPLLAGAVRFRAHAPGECAASECSLLCDDLRAAGLGRVVVDPSVRVSYRSVAAERLFWAEGGGAGLGMGLGGAGRGGGGTGSGIGGSVEGTTGGGGSGGGGRGEGAGGGEAGRAVGLEAVPLVAWSEGLLADLEAWRGAQGPPAGSAECCGLLPGREGVDLEHGCVRHSRDGASSGGSPTPSTATPHSSDGGAPTTPAGPEAAGAGPLAPGWGSGPGSCVVVGEAVLSAEALPADVKDALGRTLAMVFAVFESNLLWCPHSSALVAWPGLARALLMPLVEAIRCHRVVVRRLRAAGGAPAAAEEGDAAPQGRGGGGGAQRREPEEVMEMQLDVSFAWRPLGPLHSLLTSWGMAFAGSLLPLTATEHTITLAVNRQGRRAGAGRGGAEARGGGWTQGGGGRGRGGGGHGGPRGVVAHRDLVHGLPSAPLPLKGALGLATPLLATLMHAA
ncbi:hypothetical protein HYH03_005452 [Edaphochlamys debaryana]|uniref:Uncharacterized protein n=1 Tax=Edaphochlamys debaryana TaxID=47281 RepID=A0A836C176_9CHLO|nr:hypothetical protein HYH03_005452 [Edaphochlamys debaryana]|eukprot:KAG2496631.1 hypothetical protein HYH03_005452 [Edaphochlamys debaryana]